MDIKTFIAAAVVALTAACTQAEQAEQTEVVEVPANEAAAPAEDNVELNDDGSVKEDGEGKPGGLRNERGDINDLR